MSATTSIEWTDRTWNPVRGCALVSEGCRNCYAMKVAHRFSGPGKPYENLTRIGPSGPTWTGQIRLVDDALEEPLRWRKPQRVFVNSMSDLFHEDVPDAFIDRVFAVMALCPQHTFQVLTKRAERMREYMTRPGKAADVATEVFKRFSVLAEAERQARRACKVWPLPNVRLGVSIEDKPRASRFDAVCELGEQGWNTMVSMEPLLDDVEIPARYLALGPRAWIIPGGESSSKARPCALEWIERRVVQCQDAGVAVFVKQLGAYVVSEARTVPADMMSDPSRARREFRAPNGEVWAWRAGLADKKGGDPEEWPAQLRIRQFPEARR